MVVEALDGGGGELVLLVGVRVDAAQAPRRAGPARPGRARASAFRLARAGDGIAVFVAGVRRRGEQLVG